jgi:hypothetical protein
MVVLEMREEHEPIHSVRRVSLDVGGCPRVPLSKHPAASLVFGDHGGLLVL